jgi:hypothetical protein
MEHDDFLFRLIEAGHTAIFQWIAVYVASGIGLIEIIIEILRTSEIISFNITIYGIIYLVLISLMTLSVYSILNIMHKQNGWANQLSNENQKKRFFESRSWVSEKIVKKEPSLSTCEIVLIIIHFLLLLGVGKGIWLLKAIVTLLF